MKFRAKSNINRILFIKLAIMACTFSLSGFAGTARAADVTLAWDAPAGVTFSGYKLYYEGENDDETYGGIGASEGDSPVVIYLEDLEDADAPTYTLTGLRDEEYYYFAVTAFRDSTDESWDSSEETEYSNEVGLNTGDLDGDTGTDGTGSAGTDDSKSGSGGGCFITTVADRGADGSRLPAVLLLLGAASLLVSRHLKRRSDRRAVR